jgi:filamentous hemagglutinin
MKCKICGSECPPGAKICRDCAAARKRAFATTVTEPLLATAGAPSVSAPRFAPKPPKRPRPSSLLAVVHDTSRPEAPPAALPLNVVPKSLGVHWLLIGVAIATTIVVLAVKVLSSASHATEDVAAPTAAAATPALAAAPLPPPPVDVHAAPEVPPPVKAGEFAPAKHTAERVSRKSAARTDTVKPAAIPPPAPEPAPVARAPAPPPRPVEVPRADPMQAMNEGLSRCAREDLFSRAACEQRLRLQYCPNYWGLVPQCPIGPSTDHGQ